jgi:hypothetical protein
MPTSQDWHVVIIGGFPAIRHRRTAKSRKIAIGIIADRAPLRRGITAEALLVPLQIYTPPGGIIA